MKPTYLFYKKYSIAILLSLFCLLTVPGCKKYLDIPLPVDRIAGESAFTNDASCAAIIDGILGPLANGSDLFDGQGIGFLSGLYTDELTNYNISETNRAFYSSVVNPAQGGTYWLLLYPYVYRCNTAIEGISTSTSTINHRDQWLGEAYFLRALLYFTLTELYGDVPLAVTSDYRVNNALSKTSQAEVYQQIISDLLQAQQLLPENYRDRTGSDTDDRGRPNRAVATAFLSRLYLYAGDWQEAAATATEVIGKTSQYGLPALNQVFLVNSQEMIWGLARSASNTLNPYVRDYATYHSAIIPEIPEGTPITNYGVFAGLSDALLASFEEGDQRLSTWTFHVETNPRTTTSYTLPFKYQSNINGQEYVVVFRLAEQYLIRAEAKARLNDLNGAKSDLNVIRERAGLGGTVANGSEEVLAAIAKERQIELFSEQGHRFFDLRRMGQLDAVMAVQAPLKNGSWNSFQQYWPIPISEVQANPNLTQNPGY